MDEQGWTTVVAAATRAPSIHNTQPWRFTASGDRLDLHRDRDRALPVLDPTGRQQVISCGVAAEFASVALLAAGVEAEVDLLPSPEDPDHLVTLRAGAPREVLPGDAALAEATGAGTPSGRRSCRARCPTRWSSGSRPTPGGSVCG